MWYLDGETKAGISFKIDLCIFHAVVSHARAYFQLLHKT